VPEVNDESMPPQRGSFLTFFLFFVFFFFFFLFLFFSGKLRRRWKVADSFVVLKKR